MFESIEKRSADVHPFHFPAWKGITCISPLAPTKLFALGSSFVSSVSTTPTTNGGSICFLPPSTTIAEAIRLANTVSVVYLRREQATFLISTCLAESGGGGGVGSVPGLVAVTSAVRRCSISAGVTNFGCW